MRRRHQPCLAIAFLGVTLLAAAATALAAAPQVDLSQPGQLPPSAGFADPDDLSALLGYRLPAWSSRVWTLGFQFDGEERGASQGDAPDLTQTRFHTNLDSDYHRRFEGEQRQGGFAFNAHGTNNSNGDSADSNWYESDMKWLGAAASGWARHYLGDRWALLAGADASWFYESIEYGGGGVWPLPDSGHHRSYDTAAYAGVGYGRVRDVTPLIRAARLGERLAALGLYRPSAGEVIAMAQGLARQPAYQTVFERPDRRFWTDVLAPVAARADLSPFEIYYLADILREDVGLREEGWRVDLTLGGGYDHEISDDDVEAWNAGPALTAQWSRNLSLAHQLSATFATAYSRRWGAPSDSDHGELHGSVAHLWLLADRVTWRNGLTTDWDYSEREFRGVELITRSLEVELSSRLVVSLEDRVALVPAIEMSYRENRDDPPAWISRDLRYSLAVTYALDRTLW